MLRKQHVYAILALMESKFIPCYKQKEKLPLSIQKQKSFNLKPDVSEYYKKNQRPVIIFVIL